MIALNDATALYPSLLTHAYSLTGNMAIAEDIVQDAYLRMCEKPPRATGDSQFRAWMNVVIKNLVVDHFRQAKIEGELNRCQVCGSWETRWACCG